MTTPYLIIDNDLCQSIENAALRGVDVRIIVPHIPDKKLVFGMTRSFYPRLMAAGGGSMNMSRALSMPRAIWQMGNSS